MYVGRLSLHFRCLFCGRTCGSTSSASGCESPVIQPFVTSSKSFLPPLEGNSQRWFLRQKDLATLSLRSSKKTSSSSSSSIHGWLTAPAFDCVRLSLLSFWPCTGRVLGEGGWGTSDCGDGGSLTPPLLGAQGPTRAEPVAQPQSVLVRSVGFELCQIQICITKRPPAQKKYHGRVIKRH